MKIIAKTGRKDLANVYLAEMQGNSGKMIEFVDSCDPETGGREKKWVIILSSQYGCPVGCLMCDAGGDFRGNLSFTELLMQINHVLLENQDVDPCKCGKLKIQFARMGEPALNDSVIDAIYWLTERYPRAIPCVSTIAPARRERWFDSLLNIACRTSDFQLQFSLHTTNFELRDKMIPHPKMSWKQMSEYGNSFYRPGHRKPSLNFALSPDIPVSGKDVLKYFNPKCFAVKLTPLNPTYTAGKNSLECLSEYDRARKLVAERAKEFSDLGYEVIESVGIMEENEIGSNCGQMVRKYNKEQLEYDKALA
jgi:23S rRNA (adenine2503-C2)-methyltransferase